MNAGLHQHAGQQHAGGKPGKDGKVLVAGRASAIDCTIRDITRYGALVSLPMFGEVPDRFELAIPSSNSLMPVRVMGRSQEGVSLIFTGPSRRLQADEQPAEQAGIILAEPLAAGKPADRPENDEKFKINPGFELSFTPDLIYSTKGWCKVAVMIRNFGAIVAHQPFLCLPLLGLRLEPAKGWLAQDVTSIRKMRRFSQPGLHDLGAGDRTHCCNIVLPFTPENGGTLEYEAGAKHALRDLPDLKLTCIAGAGNYPSDRVPFTVPANDIRQFFVEMQRLGRIPELVDAEPRKEETAAA